MWLEGRDVDSIQIRLGPGRVHFRPTRTDGPPQVADGPPLILSFSDALPTNPPDGPPNDPDGPPLVADGIRAARTQGMAAAHPVRPCLTRFFRGVAILRVEASIGSVYSLIQGALRTRVESRSSGGAAHGGEGDRRHCSASGLLRPPLHCPSDLHRGATRGSQNQF